MQEKKGQKILNILGFCARGGNKILSMAINLVAVVVLLYGSYVAIDTWAVFKGAGVNEGLLIYKPTLTEKDAENPTVQELIALYPDTRAWLTLDDTNIDYPVVQTDDNNYYVNKDMDGAFSLSGEIFLDCRNAGDFSDQYAVIYGHHMEMQAMFGGLDLFLDQDYLDSHTTGVLFLPNKSLEIQVFACVSSNAYDIVFFNPAINTTQQQQVLLEQIQENASTYRDIGVDENDQIIGLATCSSSGTNARTIVFGVLK